MNFYQMDVYEIERYIRNNSIEASTLTEVLLEKLKEVSYKYEQLTEVLDDRSYSTDPQLLDDELEVSEDFLIELKQDIENLRDENAALQNDINVLQETFANP